MDVLTLTLSIARETLLYLDTWSWYMVALGMSAQSKVGRRLYRISSSATSVTLMEKFLSKVLTS